MQSEYKYILCDIEGTTTSIHFVSDVLFPFFRSNIHELNTFSDTEIFTDAFLEAQKIAATEGVELKEKDQFIKQLVQWSLEDRKIKPLKDLQGVIWKKGYEQGILKGHVFDDVLPAFERWIEQSFKIAIYSSGSVPAQKLLLEHSIKGDLSKYLCAYFDTKVGSKKEINSYKTIATLLDCSEEKILFLSDAHTELECASKAGYNTIQLCREQMQPTWKKVAFTFDDIF